MKRHKSRRMRRSRPGRRRRSTGTSKRSKNNEVNIPASLMAQCFDWVEVCRAARGEVAEDDADDRRKYEGYEDDGRFEYEGNFERMCGEAR